MANKDGLYGRETLRRLLQRVRRAVGETHQAEDLLQQAFVKLEEFRARQQVTNPEGFLVRVATNIAIDESRRRRVSGPSRPVDFYAGIADERPLQDEVLEAQERLASVARALATLTHRTRGIFLMHRVEGLKYRQIASALGITVSAVEKHIAKAVLVLSEAMSEGN